MEFGITEFRIENMTCGGCVKSVTRAIQSVDPKASVEADLATHRVKVETSAPAARLRQVLEEAGFEAVAA